MKEEIWPSALNFIHHNTLKNPMCVYYYILIQWQMSFLKECNVHQLFCFILLWSWKWWRDNIITITIIINLFLNYPGSKYCRLYFWLSYFKGSPFSEPSLTPSVQNIWLFYWLLIIIILLKMIDILRILKKYIEAVELWSSGDNWAWVKPYIFQIQLLITLSTWLSYWQSSQDWKCTRLTIW